jgi:hypothetical protein
MDQIANNVLTAPIEKNMIFSIFFYSHKLAFVLCFSQAPPSLWDFFQLSSTCLVHLKIGTCSLYIMLNNNFNYHIPWDSQNPIKLNQKQALLASLKKKNNNFQHYIILSAYEVKDETSTNKTYISLIFYHMVRSRKILIKKELQVLFSKEGSFEWFCTKIPLGLYGLILHLMI